MANGGGGGGDGVDADDSLQHPDLLQNRGHALVCVVVQLVCFTALVFFAAAQRPAGRVANGGGGGGDGDAGDI